MVPIPIPQDWAAPISERAAQIAREQITRYGWSQRSSGAIHPVSGEGTVGLRSSQHYLMYQERGIRPFVMWWVEGRLVPITDRQSGQRHVVRGRNPGQPGWVMINGQRIWRDQRWKHPGLAPKGFMRNAIHQAVQESRGDLGQRLLRLLGGEELG